MTSPVAVPGMSGDGRPQAGSYEADNTDTLAT